MSEIAFGAPDPPSEPSAGQRAHIPAARYTSREFMQLERELLWAKTWQVAGLAGDLQRPGDYFVYEVGAESILVVRDAKGAIGAFHNVCLHRGHTLADPGIGNCRDGFTCPYHDWVWGIDGSLEKVPHRSQLVKKLPVATRQLRRVACEVWAGFVWICIDPPAQSLAEYLGPIYEHVGNYVPDDFRVNYDWTAEWECNWKTAIDGFNETYHGPMTHPQFCDFLDTLSATFQFGETHSVFIIRHAERPPEEDEPGEIREPIASMLREAGADPEKLHGKSEEARQILHTWLRERAREAGRDLSRLLDGQLTDTHHFYAFPNSHIDFHGVNDVTLQRFRPHPTDPDRCFIDAYDMKRRPDRVEPPPSPEQRPQHLHIEPGAEQATLVYTQDIERLSRVQRGMHTRGFESAVLSHLERRIHHMHECIDRYLGDHVPESMRVRLVDLG